MIEQVLVLQGFVVMTSSALQASSGTDAWIHALRHTSIEQVLLPLLLQLIVIILAARLFAALFRRIGQPAVVGEIAAGLILGPSVLGRLFPDTFNAIFHPAVAGMPAELSNPLLGWMLTTLSQLGLVLLLFLIGMEFDFSHLRRRGRSALTISVSGVALPFALGIGLALVMQPFVVGDVSRLGFALFLGTALSITAIPILGRMMMELGITRTQLGALTISAAAVDDATGWILLAAVAAFARAEFNPGTSLLMVAQTVGFAVVMIFVAQPVLRSWARRTLRRGRGQIGLNTLAVLLAMLFSCAIVTNLIGIFAIFGAFFLGAVLSAEQEFCQAVSRRLRDFVTAFFLPIFFTYTGLRTDIGTLGSWELWLFCGGVLVAAIVGKLGGCGLAAWLSGLSAREAACIGTMMNCRALMELIVINVGYDLGIIPPSVFCMLVIMALVTTFMTTPVLLWLMRGTELEPHIRQSGFVSERALVKKSSQETVQIS
jgi:Kef-type K+ transport system membrane component KefB